MAIYNVKDALLLVPGLATMDINNLLPISNKINLLNNIKSLGKKATTAGINVAIDYLSNKLSEDIFGESELGRGMGTLFSSGISSVGNTLGDNLLKGATLTKGLGINAGTSLAGAGTGLAANYMGQGITSALGDSKLARGIGQGVATGLGTTGGTTLSNLMTFGKASGEASKLFGTGDSIWTTTKTVKNAAGNSIKTAAGAINPYALGAQVLGTALGAAMGPSKEYGGTYGGITQGLDMGYDVLTAGANFIPGAGLAISGVMALNKGLSNLFGSTDGMTVLDAILGSAFMPAPIKWLNMWGSSKTGTFDKLSWQNISKAENFMGNAFGNLNDRFKRAREEAGKTYGTFSQGAKRRALENIDFANRSWWRILDMADQNIYQNIRSQDMSSINNLRYALMIRGGWSPIARGKQGMKILNNATNHNIGMRLLSGAALIDNKQMILCNVPD